MNSYVGWQHYKRTYKIVDDYYRIIINVQNIFALSNLIFEEGPCPEIPDVLSCDFDDEFLTGIVPFEGIKNQHLRTLGCGNFLKPVLNDDGQTGMTLIRSGGKSYLKGTDHTIGHMSVYLNAGLEHVVYGMHKKTTIKVKRLRPEDGARCFSFWFQTTDEDKNSMWQVLQTIVGSNSSEVLIERNPNYYGWKYRQITLDPIVAIDVQIDSYHTSHLIFGDFKMTKGKCGDSLNCDFENGFCDLHHHLDGTSAEGK